jgi:hypothetical protein
MSRLKTYAKKSEADYRKHEGEQVVNYMDGISYTVNPLLNLEMIAASAIFGEPKYYEKGGINENAQKFIAAIDVSLDFNFKATIELAVKLRNEYNMRLNPAIICIRAAMHKNRKGFNEDYKGLMSKCIRDVINIPTDIWNQFEAWMMFNKTKNHLPTILKRVWAKELEGFSRYQLAKYKTTASIIDLVRITHANNENINELMKTGNIETKAEEKTWETLRAQKKSWADILETTYVPHMALLRNLRGIFTEQTHNYNLAQQIAKLLLSGVEKGRQFPFRYYTALQIVDKMPMFQGKSVIMDALNMCINNAMANFPKLKGRTACLSDNSGSAWDTFNSEYGSVTIANIDNLSSIMTAVNSDEGEVYYFGDKLGGNPVSKTDGILNQMTHMDNTYGRCGSNYVGGSTENGIWIFFRDAITNKIHYDNIFIYSDQQAGHGGLYGLNGSEYHNYTYGGSRGYEAYIDVLKLVQEYRRKVNPNVNVFSVQTAGYDNSVLPENEHRTCILTGWTGKESLYAKQMIDIWDRIDGNQKVIHQEPVKIVKVRTHK